MQLTEQHLAEEFQDGSATIGGRVCEECKAEAERILAEAAEDEKKEKSEKNKETKATKKTTKSK